MLVVESGASPPSRHTAGPFDFLLGFARGFGNKAASRDARRSTTVLVARQFPNLVDRRADDRFRHIARDLDLADFPRQDEVHRSLPRLFVGTYALQDARSLQLHARQPAK